VTFLAVGLFAVLQGLFSFAAGFFVVLAFCGFFLFSVFCVFCWLWVSEISRLVAEYLRSGLRSCLILHLLVFFGCHSFCVQLIMYLSCLLLRLDITLDFCRLIMSVVGLPCFCLLLFFFCSVGAMWRSGVVWWFLLVVVLWVLWFFVSLRG